MGKRALTVAAITLTLGVAAAGIRCSSEGDGGPADLTADIDVEGVVDAIHDATLAIPQCVSNVALADAVLPESARRLPGLVAGLMSGDAVPRAFGLGTFYGSCTDTPGTLEIEQVSHEDGVTTISIVLDAYCTASVTGGKAAGDKTFLSGSATLIDHGEPSDSGPIVSRRTVEIDGDGIEMTRTSADGSTQLADMTITMSGYERCYGTPYNYFVGVTPPSEDAPDDVTIDSFAVTDHVNDLEVSAADVSVSLYEAVPGDPTTDVVVSVSQLVATSDDGDTVAFETEDDDPIVLDADYALLSGTAAMTGASGSAVIEITGTNLFEVEVNGEPLVDGPALDCSAFHMEDFFYIQ